MPKQTTIGTSPLLAAGDVEMLQCGARYPEGYIRKASSSCTVGREDEFELLMSGVDNGGLEGE